MEKLHKSTQTLYLSNQAFHLQQCNVQAVNDADGCEQQSYALSVNVMHIIAIRLSFLQPAVRIKSQF